MGVRPPPRDPACWPRLTPQDWHALVARALACNLAPLLFYNLRHDGLLDQVPADARECLSAEYYASVRRHLLFEAELQPVLVTLRQRGITSILLKGIVLAETTYPDTGLRPMADVDLLVQRADLAGIVRVLQPLGFRGADGLEVGSDYFNGELSFAKGAHQETLTLEFHQDLVHSWNFTAPLALDTAGFWQRAQPLVVAGQPVKQLALEDMLLHLCLHRAMHHGFTGLPGYVDITWAIHQQQDQIDWAVLAARARALQASTAVFVALQLAHDLLGAAVPPAALATLAPPAWRQQLLTRLVDLNLIMTVDVTPSQEDAGRVLNVAIIDSPRDVAHWVRLRLFPGVPWQKTNYALDSDAAAYLYAFLLHPLRILGGFAARAGRLLVRGKPWGQPRSYHESV
jgi:hypothetical protein